MRNTPPDTSYTTTRPEQSPQQLPPTSVPKLWNWSDFILITLIVIITFVFGYAIASSFLLGQNQGNANTMINTLAFENLLLAIEVFALIGCVYFLGLKRKKISLETFGLRNPSRNWIFIALGIGVIAALLELLISIYGPALLNDTAAAQNDLIGTVDVTWSGIIVMGVVTILGLPLAEEMYFRGFLYTFLRERLGIWTAATISILIYAIIGGDIVSILANAVLGITTTLVYERSKSLWAAILVHVIINIMFFIAYLVTTPLAKIPFI
jgi:membrane protease YdiL (CAAX protease family)